MKLSEKGIERLVNDTENCYCDEMVDEYVVLLEALRDKQWRANDFVGGMVLTRSEAETLVSMSRGWLSEYKGTRYCSDEDVLFVDAMEARIKSCFACYNSNMWNKYPDVEPPFINRSYLVMNDQGKYTVLDWTCVDSECVDSTTHWWDVEYRWSDPKFNVVKFRTIPED